MTAYAVAHFPGQVQTAAVVLEDIDDPQALLVVAEPARHQRIEYALTGVAEWRMTEIVAERDRLGELFMQLQHLGDRAGDLRDLQGVREPRAVMIAGRCEEDLRLVLQPPERLAVNDPIPIVLKRRADVVFGLGMQTASRIRAAGGLRREGVALALLEGFTNARQRRPPESWCRAPAVRPRSWLRVSARGRRTCGASRRRSLVSRDGQSSAAARARANDRCWASSDRFHGRP